MHLVQVDENTIIDLDSGRQYDYLLAPDDSEYCSCDRVRCGDMLAETMDWSSHYEAPDASDEAVNRANQQALSFWNYLKSQVKHNVVTGAQPYRFTDNGIPGILVGLKD